MQENFSQQKPEAKESLVSERKTASAAAKAAVGLSLPLSLWSSMWSKERYIIRSSSQVNKGNNRFSSLWISNSIHSQAELVGFVFPSLSLSSLSLYFSTVASFSSFSIYFLFFIPFSFWSSSTITSRLLNESSLIR